MTKLFLILSTGMLFGLLEPRAVFAMDSLTPKAESESDRYIQSLNALRPEQLATVKAKYKELLVAHEKLDYKLMLEKISEIKLIIYRYNDTEGYEEIAKRKLAEEGKQRK